ncbi:MAG: hypothetical protein PSY14_16455 [bacterium]|nr:hypothetical protein [bacterium]
MEACDDWYEEQKRKVIIAVGECGYSFDLKSGDPDEFEVDIYEMGSPKEPALTFVYEGLFGEIPVKIGFYLTTTPSPAILAWITARRLSRACGRFIAASKKARGPR